MKILKASVFFIMLIAVTSFSAFQPPAPGYVPGDKAIDFKLKNVDGKMVSLSDYKDAKGFFVIFTCNHCPFSKAYEDRINDLNKKYASKGYPVIAINPNDKDVQPADSFEKMVERAKEKKFTFPYLVDETQEIAQAYGATKTPHVFLLQKSGSDLVVKYVGAIDDNTDEPSAVKSKYAEDAADALLQNKEVSVPATKAIGCTIKWRKA